MTPDTFKDQNVHLLVYLLMFRMLTFSWLVFRVLYSPSPPQDERKINTSEVFSLPESIKSKLSAASAR